MTAGLRLFSAGSNAHGQLANETTDDSRIFQPCVFALNDSFRQCEIPGSRVKSVASGANHTLLLLERPFETDEHRTELWSCGDGRKGQLGPEFTLKGSTSYDSSVFRRIDREILDVAGINQAKYIIHDIAASWDSTYVVLRPRYGSPRNQKDIVLSMGNNDYGDLGVDASASTSKAGYGPHRVPLEAVLKDPYPEDLLGFHVVCLAAGPHHVVATVRLILEGGEEDVAIGWGACRHGQLSNCHRSTSQTKSLATTSPCLVSVGQTVSGGNSDPLVSCALGYHHTAFLCRSGSVMGIGSNKKGQLSGLRKEVGVISVHCTWNGTYLVAGNEAPRRQSTAPMEWEIRATGSRDKGQLGSGSAASLPLSGPQAVRFPFSHRTHSLANIACGSEHVLALFSRINADGMTESEGTEVWAWGWNEHGNLGLGHTRDAHLPAMIWPRRGDAPGSGHVLGIWAGCGTSWIEVET